MNNYATTATKPFGTSPAWMDVAREIFAATPFAIFTNALRQVLEQNKRAAR